MADEQGGPGWYTCRVHRAGPAETGQIYIMLSHLNPLGLPEPVFPGRWFEAFDDVKREMLATALAALPLGLTVTAALEDSVEYSKIQRLYVLAPS